MSLLKFFSRRLFPSALLVTTLVTAKTAAGSLKTDLKTKETAVTQQNKNWTPERIESAIKRIDAFVLERSVLSLKLFEGEVNHPYLDKGVLAIGVGCRIHSYKEFAEFDFKKEDGKLLTEQEKKQYYTRCLAFQKKAKQKYNKYQASYFKKFMPYCATQESMDRVLKKRLLITMNSVKEKVGLESYYNLRPEAHIAMIDMEYNLGSNKFTRKHYPKFFAAIRKLDYDTMKKECHRLGIGDTRNKSTADLFAQANQRPWLPFGSLKVEQDKKIAFHLIQEKQTKT